MYVNAVFNLMRTLCSAAIITSPTQDIMKDLREKSWFQAVISVDGEDPNKRIATIFRRFPSIKGQTWIKNIGEDSFPLWLPSDFRKQYEQKRNEATELILKKLDHVLPDLSKPVEDEKLLVVKTLVESDFNLTEAARRLDELKPRFESKWHPEQIRRIWKTFTKEAVLHFAANT